MKGEKTVTQRLAKIDYILLVGAMLCLVIALCPYSVYKSAADSLAFDGSMERMTPQFVMGLRTVGFAAFVLFVAIVLWGGYAADSRKRFFRSLLALPGRCIHDLHPFFHDFGQAVKPDNLNFWLFMVVFLCGCVIRWLRMDAPLLHDESYTMAMWGRSDLLFAVSDYHLPNNHVFHSILVNLIYHHIGKSHVLLRLPVFFSGCLLIPSVWLLGKIFYNDFTALVAAGFTAFAPYLIEYSYNARGYEIQALFSVLSVGLMVYAKRKNNIFAWFLLIFLSGLNFFTLPIALYPFGGICVWLLLNVIFFHSPNNIWRSRWQLLKYLLFMGICVSVFSMLLYVPLLRYSGWNSFFGNIYIGGTESSTFGQTMLSRLNDNVHAFSGTWPVSLVWIVAAGLCASLFFFRKNSKEPVSYGFALMMWMGLLIPFQRPNLWPRTLLFLHPFILLWAASGLSGLRFLPHMEKAAGWVCIALVIAAGFSQLHYSNEVGPDERAVQVILGREGNNSACIHFVTAAQDNAPIWMYSDEYGMPRKIFDKRESFNAIYAFVNPVNESYNGPKTLDDLLERFGPGNNFIDFESEEILMDEFNAILYRFEGRESAIIKGYGEYPEKIK